MMKILLATDGSPCSESAADKVIAEYKPSDTEVLVVHAVETQKLVPIPYSYGAGPMFVQGFRCDCDTMALRRRGACGPHS
jgi:nucleotide-binding universal stress UspA family protein